jgi:hypothetical protein
MTTNDADALVIFGATGDLAKLETFPALVGLVQRGVLNVPVIGVAKSGWGLDQFRDYAAASLQLNHMDPDSAAARKMLGLLRYVDGDLGDNATYQAISDAIGAGGCATCTQFRHRPRHPLCAGLLPGQPRRHHLPGVTPVSQGAPQSLLGRRPLIMKTAHLNNLHAECLEPGEQPAQGCRIRSRSEIGFGCRSSRLAAAARQRVHWFTAWTWPPKRFWARPLAWLP